MTVFALDRCSLVPPRVEVGNWVAYFTEIGGAGKGRWLRALDATDAWAEPCGPSMRRTPAVVLSRWERVYQPRS